MLDKVGGKARVADFGLARSAGIQESEVTHTGSVIGSPAYMSPEQIRTPDRVGPTTDVYSLGVVLYEMLTGERPFRGSTQLLLHQVLNDDPRPPRRLNDAIERDLETICLTSLEKDPSRRYASAKALVEDLERFRTNHPIQAQPPTIVKRMVKWIRRYPTVTGSAAVVFGILVLSLLVIAGFWGRTSNARRDARRQADARALEQAISLCEQGDVGRGLLTLAALLDSCQIDSPELEFAIRTNIETWRPRLFAVPSGYWRTAGEVRLLALNRAGKQVVVGDLDKNVSIWNLETNRTVPIGVDSDALSMTFCNNGQSVLVGLKDGRIGRFSSETGRNEQWYRRHTGEIRSLAVFPDGKHFVSGDNGAAGVACSWSIAESKPKQVFGEGSGPVHAVAISADGSFVAIAAGNISDERSHQVQIWSTASGEKIGVPARHGKRIRSLAIAPNGAFVVSGSNDDTALVSHATTGKPMASPLQHKAPVTSVAIANNSQTIVTASDDNSAQIWRFEHCPLPGEQAPPLHPVGGRLWHSGAVFSAVISPDNKLVATASYDGTVRMWDMNTGAPASPFLQHASRADIVAFASEGRELLTGARNGELRRWRLLQYEAYQFAESHQHMVDEVNFSPDGRLLLSVARDGKGLIRNASDLKVKHELYHGENTKVYAGEFSRDGSSVITACSDGTARIWNVAEGPPPKRTLRYPRANADEKLEVHTVGISSDGKYALTGGFRGQVGLWNIADGTLVHGHFMEVNSEVWKVVFSPSGRYFCACCDSGRVNVWNTDTGEDVAMFPNEAGPGGSANVRSMCWLDDDQLISASWNHRAQIWSISQQGAIGPAFEHDDWVWSVAVSPDGMTVASGSLDRTARLWDRVTGRTIGSPLRHGGGVWTIRFSPDGKTLLTGSSDNTARFWDTRTAMPISPPLPHGGAVVALAFHPDGTRAVTGSEDWQVRSWPTPSPAPGTSAELTLALQVFTGMELDRSGSVRILRGDDWHRRARQFAATRHGWNKSTAAAQNVSGP